MGKDGLENQTTAESEENTESAKIPPVVHMIWYGVDAPSPLHHANEKYRRGYNSIVKNSVCEIKLWTKSDCEYLVQQYPEYDGIYRAANNIMKYDIMRYLIVYHCGGTYLDADIVLKKSLANITANECFFIENIVPISRNNPGYYEPIRKGVLEHPVRIANYAFSSKPKNSIFLEFLAEIRRRMFIQCAPKRDYDVLYLTGPDVVTSVIHTMSKTIPINVVSKLVSNSIIEHTCAGEWRNLGRRV
jgi:mannosyltransferase OCH1-like enzyme